MKHLGPIILLLLFFAPAGWAGDSLRAAVDSAFARGQYEQVELLALRHVNDLITRPVETRVAVNLTTGYALIMLGREADAEGYFRRALDADPATRLDPVRISPKFRRVFDTVKAAYHPPQKTPPVSPALRFAGPRTGSVLGNLVLPGCGQFLEQRRMRGALWAGAELTLAGVFVWRLQESRQSRDAYVKEMDRAKVHSAYEQYARDYTTAWAVGIAAGTVYLASQVDLALLRHAVPLEVGAVPLESGAGVALTLRW